ncbi:hypothetical protein EVJ50_12405 [Synechococcus sp. RSCCF101]|uniref:lipid-A-disaccharide synthase-related protein n=1 Tax=Synechococcus sp. RSCCF101 TaxID=2511069 RepID=UPI001245B882|nr:lipid-A-disaccharide synthase-related protein [Synechococcus sp. RSCCF101]QEY32911.1 hypothetical protein EVJ50_12405 [Synechococcus sp. RSCCF101]
MSAILLLSNGHGEDLSGSLIGAELQGMGHRVSALPLVGTGEPYRRAGLAVLGRPRSFSTGGLGYTSWRGRLTELRQGQVFHLLDQALLLLRRRHAFALVVVVGDVIPVVLAWLSGRPVATYLVAYSSHYEGRLRLPWPCAPCLRSRRVARLFCRDALTADDLSGQLRRRCDFLGNPFLDPVCPPAAAAVTARPGRLGLLPGSRLPEAGANLMELLAVLEHLPAERSSQLEIEAALVGDLTGASLAAPAADRGWQLRQDATGTQLERPGCRVHLRWGAFSDVLGRSTLLLAMTGTASEQAVGLGRPVLQVLGHGPQFTAAFADAQRRLLGPTVVCAAGEAGSDGHHRASAQLLLSLLDALSGEKSGALQQRCRSMAAQRIGPPGGSRRMAEAIHSLLAEPADHA